MIDSKHEVKINCHASKIYKVVYINWNVPCQKCNEFPKQNATLLLENNESIKTQRALKGKKIRWKQMFTVNYHKLNEYMTFLKTSFYNNFLFFFWKYGVDGKIFWIK